MSDASVTIHNFESLLSGKSTFSQFEGEEVALLEHRISTVPAAVQPVLNLAVDSFKAGASALVGVGLTVAGPILAESTDTQTTQVLNILSALGVPTNGVLTLAEHAVLSQVITGLKAGLDRIGIKIATNGTVAIAAASAPVVQQ